LYFGELQFFSDITPLKVSSAFKPYLGAPAAKRMAVFASVHSAAREIHEAGRKTIGYGRETSTAPASGMAGRGWALQVQLLPL
jgi:hypothetical protein